MPSAILVFLSQLCGGIFIISQNVAGIHGTFPLRSYQAGEVLFLASVWTFSFMAIQYYRKICKDNESARRGAAVGVAGILSVLCGVGLATLCMYSPYPRQMIMFATGLTMSPAGAALGSASLAAALFGLTICFLSGTEGRKVGISYFLVLACGYDIEMTQYYLLAALGLWSLSLVPHPMATRGLGVAASQEKSWAPI